MFAKSIGEDEKEDQVHCGISPHSVNAQIYQCRFHVGVSK